MLSASTAAFGQGAPAPGASPSPAANTKVGHVRMWNLILLNPVGLDLVAGSGPAAKVVQTATTANFGAVYDSLPPGRYTLTVYRSGDRQTPLKTFDLPLVDRSYYTILAVQLPGGQMSVDLLSDTPDPTKPPVNRLTIRQLGLNTHGIVVTAQNFHTEPLEPGGTQVLEGLPDGTVSVGAHGTTGSNPKNWNMDVDFRLARHQTVFVIADGYNRLRLRGAASGPTPAEQAEAAKLVRP